MKKRKRRNPERKKGRSTKRKARIKNAEVKTRIDYEPSWDGSCKATVHFEVK